MNNNSWKAIENQIKSLSVIEQQIEKVRILLAEDWRFRLSRPETTPTASDSICC